MNASNRAFSGGDLFSHQGPGSGGKKRTCKPLCENTEIGVLPPARWPLSAIRKSKLRLKDRLVDLLEDLFGFVFVLEIGSDQTRAPGLHPPWCRDAQPLARRADGRRGRSRGAAMTMAMALPAPPPPKGGGPPFFFWPFGGNPRQKPFRAPSHGVGQVVGDS